MDCSDMLKILPDEERVLFVMRYLQGYTSSEIGRMFQIPDGTVRSRLASARRKLRQIWD
ncbi:MAG: sigma-70 family RNA polymerase sigma factor [Eubacteriales bacterium]|nr:sigma-70 family RNA polymerase sigma factor [Eubacteriales bacterium]